MALNVLFVYCLMLTFFVMMFVKRSVIGRIILKNQHVKIAAKERIRFHF